ncbi:MAG TPA: peptidoglycan DD-metalloendopeptidase family protein [Jatrophihabitans sp.]|jgi:hypothetical protein|uniref:peptidoglycan DD-metalloendopeptidase family protein n=1 Tax=Jatrophihabitans sp. TaxID=1932789 RepID=UPI002E037E6E|nr:peptidoglycan DD-metalloendopeptidase family protein [Jatrophihabitans sp.]
MRKILIRAVLAVLLAATCLVVGSGSPALALAPTRGDHPYSDPLFYPLRDAGFLDCVKSNPGCTQSNNFWAFTVTPAGQDKHFASKISHAGVYAMGAGVLHIGDAHGSACGQGSSWGTWVWIDHGGSVTTKYTHLSQIIGRDGQLVAAGQRIGTVGTTGKIPFCNVSYTDVIVDIHGAHGISVERPTMIACAGTRAVVWPHALFGGRYSRWNQVPQNSALPAVGSACLPTILPRTAYHPSVSAARAGSGALTVRWTAPSTYAHVGQVQLKLSRYLGSGRYEQPWHSRFVTLSGTARSVTVTGLSTGRLYAVDVSFHGTVGWSAAGVVRISTS